MIFFKKHILQENVNHEFIPLCLWFVEEKTSNENGFHVLTMYQVYICKKCCEVTNQRLGTEEFLFKDFVGLQHFIKRIKSEGFVETYVKNMKVNEYKGVKNE